MSRKIKYNDIIQRVINKKVISGKVTSYLQGHHQAFISYPLINLSLIHLHTYILQYKNR